MRIAGGTFHLRLWPTLLTLLMLMVLLGLGTWQVERLKWKENLLATIDRRTHELPENLASLTFTDDLNYRPATIAGLFQNDHIFYLFALSQTGIGGYHVLTPLHLDNGAYLLVDRGWIPYDRKPKLASEEANPTFSVLTTSVSLTGILRLPEHHWIQPKNKPEQNDWYWIDLPQMARLAGIPSFLPLILEADATPNPSGYPIGGQTRLTLPNNHFVYALTWYGLAFALVIIYGVSSFRKNAEDKERQD